MNKCFITKLPSSVDNDNLPVLGQLRINWLKQSNLTDNDARAIGLSANDRITVKVSGAHFTDSTLASNLGSTKTITSADGLVWLYVSNDADAVLTIDNKYALIDLTVVKSNNKQNINRSLYFDIDDIKYCTNLATLNLSFTQVIGDISALSKLTNLRQLYLQGTQVTGDISAIRNLTQLNYLQLYNTQVSGDISVVSNLTNVKQIILSNTQVSGDISTVSNLNNLLLLSLDYTQASGDISVLSKLTKLSNILLTNTNVSGDISALSNLTNLYELCLNNTQVSGDISALSKLTKLNRLTLSSTKVNGAVDNLVGLTSLTTLVELQNLSLTGDMSKIPANVYFISQSGRKISTNFTWTAKGRQNATLLAMEGSVPFDTTSMDNMLIDQATCTFKGKDSQPWTKTISVSGTRTSASDAAVTTLQNMGITIAGVTKAS